MRLMIATLAVCFLLFALSNGASGAAVVQCDKTPPEFHSGQAAHPNKNIVNRDQFMLWIIKAPKGTLVEFDFEDKEDLDHGGDRGKKESPFVDKKLHFDETIYASGQKVYRGPVDPNSKGKYGYKITCKLPGEAPKVIDPMIEVP